MTIELKSYDLEVAEMVVVLKCINDHPNLKGVEVGKLLGLPRTTFYRKVKKLQSIEFRNRLVDLGYSLTEVISITAIK